MRTKQPRRQPAPDAGGPRVRMIVAKGRFGFCCTLCNIEAFAADKAAAIVAKRAHAAGAPHRSTLRAARRD